jgi:hypothetical protein
VFFSIFRTACLLNLHSLSNHFLLVVFLISLLRVTFLILRLFSRTLLDRQWSYWIDSGSYWIDSGSYWIDSWSYWIGSRSYWIGSAWVVLDRQWVVLDRQCMGRTG